MNAGSFRRGLQVTLVICGVIATGCAQQSTKRDSDSSASSAVAQRAQVHTELGASYYGRRQYDVAIQELNQALDADPDFVPAHNTLGLVYMQLRDDASAEKHFRRALELKPGDSDTNNNYGWFLCQRKKEQASINYFLEAVKNPLYANPDKSYMNAGFCSLRAKDELAAEKYFLKAIELQPGNAQGLYHLADLSFKRGKHIEAKSYLRRYMQLGAPNAQALWLGVRVERKLGDKDAQASYGSQLRKNYPESKEAQALRAGRYE